MKVKNRIKKGAAALLLLSLAAGLAGCGMAGTVPEPDASVPVSVTASPSPDGSGADAVPSPTPETTPTPVVPTPTERVDVTAQPTPEETPAPTPTATPSPLSTQTPAPTPTPPEGVVDSTPVDGVQMGQESDALQQGPAAVPVYVTAASGEKVKENGQAQIDYSNTDDGYVMVRYLQQTSQRLKAQVKGPTTTYTYNLTAETWETFPLSDGSGTYQITIYKNVTESKYAAVLSLSTEVALSDEFGPFLYSNQYVNYAAAPNTVQKAAQLTAGIGDPLKKVEAVYNFVVKEFTYDTELAASVRSGYLPELDKVLAKKSGICFDYAAMMTGMLRSQGVPCKLVVGYSGSVYHAWISVWSQETGWVDGVIFFDGSSWQRMDPTFASSSGSSQSMLEYIGNGSNYSAKYFY